MNLTDLQDITECYKCKNKNLEYHIDNRSVSLYYDFIDGEVSEDYKDTHDTETEEPEELIYCPNCQETIFESITKFIKVSE